MFSRKFDDMVYKLDCLDGDPNEIQISGEAIIVHAVREEEFLPALEILIQRGANLNIRSSYQRNLIEEAIEYNNFPALKLFFEKVIVIDTDYLSQLVKNSMSDEMVAYIKANLEKLKINQPATR